MTVIRSNGLTRHADSLAGASDRHKEDRTRAAVEIEAVDRPLDGPECAGQPTGERSLSALEIFLTPRVIDRRAYEELSAEIRDLINQADTIRSTISELIAGAEATTVNLKEAAARHEERLRLGARLMRSTVNEIERLREDSKRLSELIARADSLADVHRPERQSTNPTKIDLNAASAIADRLAESIQTAEALLHRLDSAGADIDELLRMQESRIARLERLMAEASVSDSHSSSH